MTQTNWTARLAWGLLLLIAGGGLAVWGLSRWDGGARFFGVTPPPRAVQLATAPVTAPVPEEVEKNATRIQALEARLASVESETRENAGSFDRADALLIAFAARRAIDRGVPLGYLEGLLMNRFGARHQYAVARVITAGRSPERLDRLTEDYRAFEGTLRGGAPDEKWYESLRRQVGTLASIRYADKPNPRPRARFDRAVAALQAGEVSTAISETQRLPAAPGSAAVQAWTERARRYVATQRALDELESAALVGDERPAASTGSAPRQ